ncbi:MAG: protein kinase, partial [Myxococcota bacterium]
MPDTQATIDFSGQPDGGSGTTSTSAGVLLGGRFQIRELLGRGGGGDVYLAHDQLDGVDVAVKLYRPTSAQGRKRIIRELRALQLVDHPNIVRIIAHGEHDGQFYCAMTLIEGSPFPGHPGAVSWDMLAETTRRLLHALGSVHDAGLVHRDIKPDNVLVDASGQPIILDFGLARGAQIGTTVTKTGALLGTPHYLPPEQVWGHTPTPASDLYALGVMLYEALAGRLPYASTRFHQMLHQKLNEDPVHIQVHVPALPDHIADAIMRLLCREASGRPQSASDVLHHLNGEPIRPPWYGSTVLRDQLIDAARHRRSMTIRGPAGSGKTYTLQAAAAQLEQVLWLSPGRAPFSSLRPSFDPGRFADRQGAQQAVYELLSTYIERGVIIADDLPALDRWTQRLLQQMDGLCVLSSERGMGAPQPPTMTEDDLRHLFSGPEVIHHLKSDAAFELYRRTGGYPGAVRLTLQDWLSRGLCQSQGPGYITSRASLETLAAEDVPPNLPVTSELSGALHDVLEVMWLAWPHASPEQLSALLNLQDWQLELYAEDLQEMGLIEQLETGWRPLSRPQMSTREDQAALRMRIAASLPDPMDRVRIQLNAHEAPTPADLLATAHIWRRAGRREQMLATLERAIALGTEVTEAIETLCWSQGVTENTPGLARRFAALIEHRADYRDMVEQCVRARRLEDVAPPPEPWTSMPEFQAAFLATTGDEQRIVV